jgi:pimeloyl-ACP methyl ester carboxylesterase
LADWQYKLSGQVGSIYYDDPNPRGVDLVFMLHGLGVDSRSWYFQAAALQAAGYRPVVIDIPGYGRSSWPGKQWNFEQVARVLHEFIMSFPAGKRFILGISLGGAFALRLMAMDPAGYQGGLLINTFSKLRPHGFTNTFFLLTRLVKVSLLPMREQATYMASRLFPNEKDSLFKQMVIEQITATDRKVYLQTLAQIARLNLGPLLGEISVPCLLITGSDDSTILPAAQTKLAKSLPDCEQVFVPGAGHAVIVQQPDAVNAAILDFIKTH